MTYFETLFGTVCYPQKPLGVCVTISTHTSAQWPTPRTRPEAP